MKLIWSVWRRLVGVLVTAGIIGTVGTSAAGHSNAAPSSRVRYAYSFVTRICSPTDFPGMAVYLLDSRSTSVPPAGEHVQVQLWGGFLRFAHRTFRWPGGGPTFDIYKPSLGEVRLCTGTGVCRTATEGFVSLNGIARKVTEPAGLVEGRLDFQFEGGERVRQSFKAAVGPWGPCP